MAKAIVVLEGEVAELFTKVKISSTGLSESDCDSVALAGLKWLGLVRIQLGTKGRPNRVKLSLEIDNFDVRIQ